MVSKYQSDATALTTKQATRQNLEFELFDCLKGLEKRKHSKEFNLRQFRESESGLRMHHALQKCDESA